MKIIEKEFNVETGKETITERDATAEEIAEIEKTEALALARIQAETMKLAEKAALFAKLGITADEARLLLS